MNSRRSGLLLLEVVIALAIFVAVGTLILSTIRQAMLSTQQARDIVRAEDFAASVLALIESDLDTPENLNGPLPDWDPEEGFFGGAIAGAAARGFGGMRNEEWIIEIETGPAGMPGFSSIIVTVMLDGRPGVIASRETLVPLTGTTLSSIGASP